MVMKLYPCGVGGGWCWKYICVCICILIMSQIIPKTFGFLSHRLSWKSQPGWVIVHWNAGQDIESEAMNRKASKKCGNSVSWSGAQKRILSGKLQFFLFSPLLGEDSHFDYNIFQGGWNHQLVSGKLQIWGNLISQKSVWNHQRYAHFPKHFFDCKYTRYQPKISIFESGDIFSKAHHFWYPC